MHTTQQNPLSGGVGKSPWCETDLRFQPATLIVVFLFVLFFHHFALVDCFFVSVVLQTVMPPQSFSAVFPSFSR